MFKKLKNRVSRKVGTFQSYTRAYFETFKDDLKQTKIDAKKNYSSLKDGAVAFKFGIYADVTLRICKDLGLIDSVTYDDMFLIVRHPDNVRYAIGFIREGGTNYMAVGAVFARLYFASSRGLAKRVSPTASDYMKVGVQALIKARVDEEKAETLFVECADLFDEESEEIARVRLYF
jgi:hypothetical protein